MKFRATITSLIAFLGILFVGREALAGSPPDRVLRGTKAKPAVALEKPPADHERRTGYQRTVTAKPRKPRSHKLRFSSFTMGAGLPNLGVDVQLLTLTWAYFRWTLVDAGFGMGLESDGPPSLDLHVGTLLGVGGHFGKDGRSSAWLVFGLWYGEKHGVDYPKQGASGNFRGLYVPVGVELRWGMGSSAKSGLWGIRFYVAYSPLGRSSEWTHWTEERCGMFGCGGLLGEDRPLIRTTTTGDRKMLRWMFGLSVFVGM